MPINKSDFQKTSGATFRVHSLLKCRSSFLASEFCLITYLTEASSLISFSAFYLSFSLSPMICTYKNASKVLNITLLIFLTWLF